jgi:hypothetical protein
LGSGAGAGLGSGAGAGADGAGLAGGAGSTVDERIVAVNFTEENARLDLPAGEWSVEVTTVRAAGAPPGGAGSDRNPLTRSRSIELGADEAVILRAN